MAKRQSLEDLQDAGFEEVIEHSNAPKTKIAPPKPDRKDVAPYVVVDNSEQLAMMNRSNELMRKALNEMVTKLSTISQRPKALELDIKRNSSGFMDKVRIKLEY